MTDWHAYRKCPICYREIGSACVSRSGRIVGGRPDGQAVELEVPHVLRRQRTRYGLTPRA